MSDYPYVTRLNVHFEQLEVVDVQPLVDACTDRWFNQTLCKVNDSVVRLGVMQGEYHWHKHDNDDEFFYVIEGQFLIDLEDRIVHLGPRQGFVVPKGRGASDARARAGGDPDGGERGDHSHRRLARAPLWKRFNSDPQHEYPQCVG